MLDEAASSETGRVVVYRARNLVNGKSYIGYTGRGLKKREKQHRYTANGTGEPYLLHQAIRKYGQENFVFEVVMDFEGDEELAKVFEWEAISKWKPEYNLSYGGEGGTLPESTRKKIGDANRGRKMPPSHHYKRVAFLTGRKHTEEAKAKIRAANIGRPSPNKGVSPSEETRRKISEANKGQIPWTAGKTHSEETKRKMSAWQLGRTLPEEMRQNIKAARVKAWESPSDAMIAAVKENNRRAIASRMLPVKCIEDGHVFLSSSDADKFYGFPIGRVSRIVKGTIKNNTGLTFIRHTPEAT